MEMEMEVLKALGDPSPQPCRYRKPSPAAESRCRRLAGSQARSAGPANHGAACVQLGHLKRQNKSSRLCLFCPFHRLSRSVVQTHQLYTASTAFHHSPCPCKSNTSHRPAARCSLGCKHCRLGIPAVSNLTKSIQLGCLDPVVNHLTTTTSATLCIVISTSVMPIALLTLPF